MEDKAFTVIVIAEMTLALKAKLQRQDSATTCNSELN